MSVNLVGLRFERNTWWPGIVAAPGDTVQIGATRSVTNFTPPPGQTWPAFPAASVPYDTGWHLVYQWDISRHEEGDGGTFLGINSSVFHFSDPTEDSRGQGTPFGTPTPGYSPSTGDYTLTVNDADLGTAFPGEPVTFGLTTPTDAYFGAYFVGAGNPASASVTVSCFRTRPGFNNNQTAWTATYRPLDQVLVRPGDWIVYPTDIHPLTDPATCTLQITGPHGLGSSGIAGTGPGVTGTAAGAEVPKFATPGSTAPGNHRFYLLVSRDQPIPIPSLWGSTDFFHIAREGEPDYPTNPFPADSKYELQIVAADYVPAPHGTPDDTLPTFTFTIDLTGLQTSDRHAPIDVPFYIYSPAYFEPVTRSYQGITLTAESLGLLPPGMATINVHYPATDTTGHHNNAPGISPALLGRPSRHYNRVLAKLNTDRTATTGITFWRSDRPIPLFFEDRVWDTAATGVQITTTAGDNSPRLAEDHRGLLYCAFSRPASGMMLSRSDDDGATWNTPTLAITAGTHPNLISQDGRTLAAAVVSVGTTGSPAFRIKGKYQAAGDPALGTVFTFCTDGAGTAMAVQDDSFGLAFAAEGPDRIALHVLIAGETATSDWWSGDGGRTWTRVALS